MARRVRAVSYTHLDVYKRQAVHSAKSGHPGGSLSAADIFTYLYFEEMNVDAKAPDKEDRDRFGLSKGHVAPAVAYTHLDVYKRQPEMHALSL